MPFPILKKSKIWFLIVLLAFAIYSAFFIYKTSFLIDGTRFFSLFDDQMISMRYAKNLAHGYGLVWNPGGEKVEGFTNLLWTLYMSIFHLLPIDQSKMSLLIQISGLIFLILNLYFVKKIADLLFNRSTISIVAVLLVATYYPLTAWGLLGTEVSILTLIVSVVAYLVLVSFKTKKSSFWIFFWAGVAILIRLDMTVFYLAVWLCILLFEPNNRRQNIFLGFLVLLFALIPQTLFRLWYYNEILPNTYFLKMTGYPIIPRINRGLQVAMDFLLKLNFWLIFIVPYIFFYRQTDKFLRLINQSTLSLLFLFIAQLAYSIYVGGDAWEWGGANRYIAVAMPLYFILFCGLLHLWFPKKSFWLGVFVVVSLIGFNNLTNLYEPRSMKEILLIRPNLLWEGSLKDIKLSQNLKKFTSPQAKIAVSSAGIVPYFLDRHFIDMLGKNNQAIARMKMKQGVFLPGHLKYDANWVSAQKPDLIAHYWGGFGDYANAFPPYKPAQIENSTIWILKNSKLILNYENK